MADEHELTVCGTKAVRAGRVSMAASPGSPSPDACPVCAWPTGYEPVYIAG